MSESKYEDVETNSVDIPKNDKRQVFGINWSSNKIGFGTVTLEIKEGKVFIDSECMSKEFVKKVLCQMVDNSEFK